MKIKTDEIASAIKQEIAQFSADLEVTEVGRVIEVGDGIARVYGLSNAMAGELLEFQTPEGSVMGQVFNLELDTVGAVIYARRRPDPPAPPSPIPCPSPPAPPPPSAS